MTNATAIDRTYIRRHVRSRNRWLGFLAFFALLFGVLGYFNVSGLVHDITTSYTSTTGEVIDEGTQQFREGSRRHKRWVDRRVVTIEYQLGGETDTDTVRSDTIEVGESLPIWVDNQTGDVEVEQPGGPGFWNWVWAIVVPLLFVLFAGGFVVGVGNSIRLARFRPDGRQPDFVLRVADISIAEDSGKKEKKRMLNIAGAIDASSVARRVGAEAKISAPVHTVPAAQTYPPQLSGFFLREGAEGGIVVLHTPELGAWWAADLTFPGDLEVEPKAPKKA